MTCFQTQLHADRSIEKFIISRVSNQGIGTYFYHSFSPQSQSDWANPGNGGGQEKEFDDAKNIIS
jgi:hypothetical protein